MNELFNFAEDLMQKDLKKLTEELKNLRSNQISPELIGNLVANYQGQKKKIKEIVFSIYANSSHELVIKLADSKSEPIIIKTILDAHLGYQLGKSKDKEVYFSLSPMNAMIRKNLFDKLEQIIEEGKKKLRLSRQKTRDVIKKIKSQNEQKLVEKELERLNKKYLNEIEKIAEKKKKGLTF